MFSQEIKMRLRRVVIPAAILGVIAFAFYVWVLYGQLKDAFTHQEQFIPTRIYSDVTWISPPQSRGYIEDKLRGLGYQPSRSEFETRFALHALDYPIYLIPDTHPEVDAYNGPEQARAVSLQFSGPSRNDVLQAIHLGGKEAADLYLEPELVTALARGLDREGHREIRTLLKVKDVPAQLKEAIISVEDPHFDEHNGIYFRGIARAIWVDLKTLSLKQGGSTITLQLVKNLMARRNKNIFRKLNEVFLAVLLESAFDKDQILERYLNEVPLGQVGSYEVHGVAEGAELFFGKNVNELNLAEMALMAGLIRGPSYYAPHRHWDRAIQRQRFVLKRMVEAGYIAPEEADEAAKMPVRLAPPTTVANKAPYFSDFVKAELFRELRGRMSDEEAMEAGFRVYTTLDLAMNNDAQTAVAQGINGLEKRMRLSEADRLEGALASVDQGNGSIRALVGGRSYAQSTFNRILNMKRQVGSTFKPIVYLTALLKGKDPKGIPYGPGHPVEDAPWTLIFDHGHQTWAPRNYERQFLGWISFRTALAHSINTATARLGYEVGIADIARVARTLGIDSDLPVVPSLTLGVAELSPIELLRAYATFANHGVQDELTVIRAITHEDGTTYAHFVYNPQQIIDAGPIDLLTDMLQSVFTEGTAHQQALRMNFDRPAVGKTGTTSHHRDAWFAGYTPQLTTVVWVGMDQPHDDTKVVLTGADSALPIWISYMKNALAGEPPAAFALSPELVNVTIDMKSGLQADSSCPPAQVITEKYVRGNEPTSTGCAPLWPEPEHETVEK